METNQTNVEKVKNLRTPVHVKSGTYEVRALNLKHIDEHEQDAQQNSGLWEFINASNGLFWRKSEMQCITVCAHIFKNYEFFHHIYGMQSDRDPS